MPGVTTGAIEALQLEPPTLRVAGRVFTVVEAVLLRGFNVGNRVTVKWDEFGDVLRALRITLEKPSA